MRVKISLAVLFIAAVIGLIAALARIQDLNQRALEAEQAQAIAERTRNEIRAWADRVADSLGNALTPAEPPAGLGLSDTTNGALGIRTALASARYWYEQAERARNAQFDLLDPTEVALLKARGLEDPVENLRADLLRRPDLIPYEGVMGGRMRFVPTGIAVLSPEWVYARFEDGHVAGSALLAFEILRGGEIVWRRLAARLD